MKRMLGFALILAMLAIICTPALAEAPALSEDLFKYAKAAIGALANGAYDKMVANMPFSGVSPSADEWESFARGNFAGTSPQTKYAVAYWSGQAWKIAVPVSASDNTNVNALVLISEDGRHFSGYGCTTWSKVLSAVDSTPYVIWNEEFCRSTSAVVETDE